MVCEHAGIAQRWLVVFSEEAHKRELKTLGKAQTRELESTQNDWRKLEGLTFNCQIDAENALVQFNKKWKYRRGVAQAIPITQYTRTGRPYAHDQKEVVGYSLEGSLGVNETALEEAKRSLGRFIVATNELDASRLSAQAVLENYKDQGVSIKRGFRFLFKDPLFFSNSLFLKKPKRPMALLIVMRLALLIYSLAER